MNLKEYKGYKKAVIVSDQVEMYKVVVRINSFIHNIKTSITQETILAYCCAFGCNEKSYKAILNANVISNRQILYNNISDLVKMGLIIKGKRDRKICDNLQIEHNPDISPYVIIKLNCRNIIKLQDDGE